MGLYSYKVDNILNEDASYYSTFNDIMKESVILFAETAYNDVVVDYYLSEAFNEEVVLTEGFIDTIKNIIDAILTAIKKFVGKVRDLFQKILGFFKLNKDENKKTMIEAIDVQKAFEEDKKIWYNAEQEFLKQYKDSGLSDAIDEVLKDIDDMLADADANKNSGQPKSIEKAIDEAYFEFHSYDSVAEFLCSADLNYNSCKAVESLESQIGNIVRNNSDDYNIKGFGKDIVESIASVDKWKSGSNNIENMKKDIHQAINAKNSDFDKEYFNSIIAVINNASKYATKNKISVNDDITEMIKGSEIGDELINRIKRQYDTIANSDKVLTKKVLQLQNVATNNIKNKDSEKNKNNMANLKRSISEISDLIMFNEQFNFAVMQNGVKIVNKTTSEFKRITAKKKNLTNSLNSKLAKYVKK